NLRIYLHRPSNIYGPNDHFGKNENQVIPSFIKKIAAGEPIEIWGDGSQTRQFIYVKDVVYSVLSMVEGNYTGALNVSTDEFVSILNLAKIIYERFDKTSNVNLNPAKSIGVKSRILDTSKMYELIDFELTSLENGIQQTINWYQNSNL
ncbi:MAG: NAD-dependent epimerase/dehydratase family protein, partial [Candidatus Heimdallarchaeota archaeon]